MGFYDYSNIKPLALYTNNNGGGQQITKFGLGLVGTTWGTVWSGNAAGLYTYPDGVTDMYVASTDADDNASGAGCQLVNIIGLDPNYEVNIVQIALDGQNPVILPGEWLRVYRMQNISSEGHDAQGTISVGYAPFVGGEPTPPPFAEFTPEYNQSQMALLTIPKGYTLLLKRVTASVPTGKECQLGMYVREEGGVFKNQGIIWLGGSVVNIPADDPLAIGEKSDLEFRGKVDVASNLVSVIASGLIVRNDHFKKN